MAMMSRRKGRQKRLYQGVEEGGENHSSCEAGVWMLLRDSLEWGGKRRRRTWRIRGRMRGMQAPMMAKLTSRLVEL